MARRALVVVVLMAALAFLFFVPVVYVQPPPPFFGCPLLGPCNFTSPMYESVTYWAFHAGGAWMYRGYYTVTF